VISDACEDIGEPCLRVNVVEPGSLDQRVDDGGTLPAAVGAAEQPCLATERDAAQGALGGIVAEADCRFDCCYANDAQESGSPTLAGGPARAQACEDRDSGARQQDSTDCLGRDDAEGGLRRRRITRAPSLDNRVMVCV